MSEAPERIWAWRNDCGDVWTGEWSDEQDEYTPSDALEYIRADIAERELAEARAETLRAKTIISKACNHLPNGAFCSPEASLDFMERVPDEVLIVTSGLVNKITAAEAERDRLAADNAQLRQALTPFAGDKLPTAKRTKIDYNRWGLRCAISPLELARDRARASLQTGEKGE